MGEVGGHRPNAVGVLDQEGVECWWGPQQVHRRAPYLTQPLPGAHQPCPPIIRPDICCIEGLKPFESVYV